MKLFAPLAAVRRRSSPISYPIGSGFGNAPLGGYQQFARAYMTNEIVFAAIEMLATSAGEPHIIGRRWQRNSPMIRNEERRLLARGLSHADTKARLIEAGFYKDLPNHPLVNLLEKPNPWMSRGQMWGTVVMDRALAGNAYFLKVRFPNGPLRGKVAELWRLRPDRVRIIPDAESFIAGYEYSAGQDKVVFPADDVVHFKTRHPLNDYYGMSQLQSIWDRISIDANMKNFLRTFYERGGTGPGSVLTVAGKLSADAKEEIRDHARKMFNGPAGMEEWLILDGTESTYTPLGLNRGLRDALPAELDSVSEARNAMVFGIPGSILGLKIGYESSSYANKRQDWQVFWDLTMTPLLSDFDDALNLQLTPEFGQIDEVLFDLSDIRALQEDVEKIHDRHRANLGAGLETWEEAREGVGLDPGTSKGIVFVPANMKPTEVPELAEEPEPMALPEPPKQLEAPAAIIRPQNPLPKPRTGEDQAHFMDRCMSDDTVKQDFDSHDQRTAVCLSQWRDAHHEEMSQAEVRHTCGRLVARDVQGNPELWCPKCRTGFRPSGYAPGIEIF